ncbi:hypothetical protein D3A96_01955 [Robertkochia marina]|nr:hypothetical protein D3A96_01955 [Robertkochia marina]
MNYYFSVPEDDDPQTPNTGLRDLHPNFEKIWNTLEFDPFFCFPETNQPLPEDIVLFLQEKFQIKKQQQELNVFLAEQWEECLVQIRESGVESRE